MHNFSLAEIIEVPCMECDAKASERCIDKATGVQLFGFHKSRIECRERMPVLPKELPSLLTPTDKSITIYYAFVALCDSVAANSEKMFNGKKFSSQDIQKIFGKQGFKAAQADGMIGIAPANRKQRRTVDKKKRIILQ